MKKTPMYETHRELKGKIIDFGGWALPVQYTGILDEHQSVRNAAGLFDVSHMGEILIEGEGAFDFIQTMIANDLSKLKDYQILYSPMCNPMGGIIDDLLIYKISQGKYLLVVNASNTEKDYHWLKKHETIGAKVTDVSSQYAQFALQGPNAEKILQRLVDYPLGQIKFFYFSEIVDLSGVKMLVSRTGYTGEDGFEIYISPDDAIKVWNKLLDSGKEDGIAPVGLGARDTLRFEAGLTLYGQEISEDISPLETGLQGFVKLDKGEFIGKEALVAQKNNGITRKLVGFEMIDRGIPRSHYRVQHEEDIIGYVTTGGFSPTLKKNIGMALINTEYSSMDTEIDIVVREKPLKAKVVKIPFYQKRYKKGF